MKSPPKNIAASVRDRLKALAVQQGENFDLVLVRYGIERLLYRLSLSPLRSQFVLKGATLFRVWDGAIHRETRDLDLAGFGDSSVEALIQSFRTICAVQVPDDGLAFLDVHGEPLQMLEDYGGVRLTVLGKLTAARINIQVDVGFGNRITPAAKEIEFPTLLDFPAPILRAYPAETVVAEKLQALVDLGFRNSRLKDYFDLWHIGRNVRFDG
ncbi:MAG: nucleotidyl transferase AbiEii/AbiGii toxin family protein, partial [Bryobacteraceae bacterium]